MSYLERLERLHTFAKHRHRYVPVLIGDATVGFVTAERRDVLLGEPAAFVPHGGGVAVQPGLTTPQARTETVGEALERLAARGDLPKLRGEIFPVVERWGAPELMQADRRAITILGMWSFGLHVNGIGPEGTLWLGKRAANLGVAPGAWDNMIAGGQPAGMTLAENLRKEAQEEAGIDATLADRAFPVGAMTYAYVVEQGVRRECLFCYDLVVPEHVVPHNTDGEVERFVQMTVAEALALVRDTTSVKTNVNGVLLHFALRHGHLDPDTEADYTRIAALCSAGYGVMGWGPGMP